MCFLISLLHAGWNRVGKLHGSRKVIKWDSLGKKSILRTLNCAICSLAIDDLSSLAVCSGGNTGRNLDTARV